MVREIPEPRSSPGSFLSYAKVDDLETIAILIYSVLFVGVRVDYRSMGNLSQSIPRSRHLLEKFPD